MSTRRLAHSLLVATCALIGPEAFAGDDPPRYVKTPTGYLMVLRRGDDVLANLEKLVAKEKIPSASLAGIGFLREVTFGFFDAGKRQFDPKTFHDVEMTGMTGSLAWKDGKPSIHAHATVAGRDFAAVGGHLLALEVGTGSVEITVTVHDTRLERREDPALGANVLSL